MGEKLKRIIQGIGTHISQQFTSLVGLLGCMVVGWLIIFCIIFVVFFVALDILQLNIGF
jgi:hypothetical protein